MQHAKQTYCFSLSKFLGFLLPSSWWLLKLPNIIYKTSIAPILEVGAPYMQLYEEKNKIKVTKTTN